MMPTGIEGRAESSLFKIGTLIFGNEEKENTSGDGKAAEDLYTQACEYVGEPRFLVSGASMLVAREKMDGAEHDKENARGYGIKRFRRYYIELESELNDRMIAEICRGGWNQRPVLLKNGEEIYCSGLLKYKK